MTEQEHPLDIPPAGTRVERRPGGHRARYR